MTVFVVFLLILTVGGAVGYPHMRNRLETKQKLFEIEQRESKIKGYLTDSRIQVRERAEAYFDRKALIEIGMAEAQQAADILDTEEIKELVGGEFQLQEVIEVLRSNQKSRETDVKLLNAVNEEKDYEIRS